MTTIGATLDAEWKHLFHHDTPPVPTFTPHAAPAQPEVPVSSPFAELQHLLAVADEDAIRACGFLLAHPEGLALVSKAATVAGSNVPPGTLTSAVAGLDAVLGMVSPGTSPVPSQVPSDAAQPVQQDASATEIQ